MRGPGLIGEVEEIEQVGLRGIACCQMSGAAEKAGFHEFNDGGMVHRDVRDIVPTRIGRDNDIRHPEAKLGSEALHCRRIRALSARISGTKVAVESWDSICREARFVAVWIDRDRRNIGNRAEARVRS